MSGQQIGAVVGGIIGAFFGMPQLGAAIGGMIGGWISPTQVNGPHIGDGAAQNSAEGQPIAWILGTAGWVSGNIVQISARREVKKTDDGKGSGTEVNTFEAHQDFCIMICESSETRDSLMVGVLIVKVDGKIVYDMRPGKNFGAENNKFLKNHTFYDGNESQLPDPTMEAITGVGNTPAYRGVYTMVARDINLSQYGERIPNYEFVMVGAGEQNTEVLEYLSPPAYGRFINADFPLADPQSFYTFTGTRNAGPGAPATFSADTIEEIIEHFEALGYQGYPSSLSQYVAYSASTSNAPGGLHINQTEEQLDVTSNTSVILIYNEVMPSEWFDVGLGGGCTLAPYEYPGLPEWYGINDGSLIRVRTAIEVPPNYGVSANCTNFPPDPGVGTFPYLQTSFALYIKAESKASPPEAVLGDPCILGVPVLLPDDPGHVIDCAGNVTATPTYAPVTGSFLALQEESFATVDARQIFEKYTLGPVIEDDDPIGTEAFWTAAYNAAVVAGNMEAGLDYGDDYPVSISNAWLATSESTELTSDPLGLDTAITRIAVRGGLTPDDIDVTEMDQELLGFPILQPYNGADCIRPLMTGFTSYGSEYDAKLRFHKHGEAIEVLIGPEDFIEGSETDKSTREQALEYPRLLSVTAIDPTQDYIARPQTERRITPDVRAIGEETMQVPIVMTPDSQRQLAAIGMKVSWARAVGSREFAVPYATNIDTYLKLVAGAPFALDGQRRIVSELSLQDGEIRIKGLYDRQSAYTSSVTATPALPPTPPPSSIGGVTLFAALNLPVLRDQDDQVGLYFAVAGLLDSWAGALLQVSADDQASWQTAIPSMTQTSTMGYLTAPLALAPTGGDDITNTLSVAVHGGQLNSITRLQFLNEGNPCAIVKPGDTGECEVLSFQTADETATDEYDLTTLSRGGLSTAPAAHPQGARFVALDSVYFWQVPSAWIGRTLWFRPVTFGTSPDNNAAYSIVFQPAVSQTEWQPMYLTGSYGVGSSFRLSVTPRHRLGNDSTPIASANFTGFRWTATDALTTYGPFDTVDPSYTFDLTSFTGTVTFTVSQLNRITGPGPSTSLIL